MTIGPIDLHRCPETRAELEHACRGCRRTFVADLEELERSGRDVRMQALIRGHDGHEHLALIWRALSRDLDALAKRLTAPLTGG